MIARYQIYRYSRFDYFFQLFCKLQMTYPFPVKS